MNNLDKIRFNEAEYYYKSEHAIVDYSQMQTYSLIKSCIEVFAYYDITDFTAVEMKAFFEKLQLVQQKNYRVFNPSVKKVSGVLDWCLTPGENYLSVKDNIYHVEKWNTDGYKYEMIYAREKGYI